MSYRNQLILTLMAALFVLPGCNLVKKAARGEKISRGDMVNAADSQVKENERKKEQIAKYEASVREDLKEIEELRQKGSFSSSTYREKRLNQNLTELGKLDGKNALLTAAPKQLESIKSTYTEEVYAKKTLVAKCKDYAEKAKKERMEEDWRGLERNIDYYVKCRRELKDKGVEESIVAEQDQLVIAEYDLLAEYILKTSEAARKEKKFGAAVALETGLERHMGYYKELSPNSAKPEGYLATMKKTQKTYRDPEEVKAEQAAGAYSAWRRNVQQLFNEEMTRIEAAEAAAKPAFDEGVAAMGSGDKKKAVAKLLEARQTLYSKAYPSGVALETAYQNGMLELGLSYEIAASLAKIYFEEGDKTKLYPELSLIKNGRKWMEKDKELMFRMYEILTDREGKKAPKASELVQRYAGRYSDERQKLAGIADVAKAQTGEAYNLLGVSMETISTYQAGGSTEQNIGKITHLKDQTVSSVSGGQLNFDFRGEYKEPYNCKSTGKISSINYVTGRVYYQQNCQYRTKKRGYILHVPVPKGVSVKKGDKVDVYATVKKKSGQFDVMLGDPGFVRVSSAGATVWFLGSKVK